MSKIGRKPIIFGDLQVTVKGQEVSFKGKNHSGVYFLPDFLTATVEGHKLILQLKAGEEDRINFWGMHRALLANALKGAEKDFELQVEIVGLGHKAALSGHKITLSLGFSHKIDVDLPADIKLAIDKTGQKLTFTSFDKEKLGQICALIRSFRPPEPYKLTGVRLAGEVIHKKAGKAKSGTE